MSGAGVNDFKWTYGVRVIANQIDRAKWRNTLTYRFHPRFTAGIEYNPRADEVAPLVDFLVLTETAKVHPLLSSSRGRHPLSLVMLKVKIPA